MWLKELLAAQKVTTEDTADINVSPGAKLWAHKGSALPESVQMITSEIHTIVRSHSKLVIHE